MATQVSLTDGAVASAGALAIQTNGTTQAVSISTGQVATLAQNPILTSGTANGVAYLNGSKAVTSGSALTFDGTNFATTGTASATKMIPTGGSATGNGMYLPASNTLAWSNNGSETMRLDSAGNLGLGVTPSAWALSGQKVLQVLNASLSAYTNDEATLSGNAYHYGSGWKYISSNYAEQYVMAGGAHKWYNAASGTAGNAITFTQAMTLDASGNLGIGVTSMNASLHVQGAATTDGALSFNQQLASTTAYNSSPLSGTMVALKYTSGGSLAGMGGWAIGKENSTDGNYSSYLGLYTRANGGAIGERARIDSSGNLLVGTTSPVTGSRFAVKTSSNTSATYGAHIRNSSDTTLFALEDGGVFYTGTAAGSPYNNTTGSAANVFVASTGVLFRSTSSLKYKTDVQDATHGLAEVMQLRSVTYKGKKDGDTVFGGLIAEEVDAAGLTEFVQYADDGTPDALAYGNMVSLCIKAIQEMKAIIDQQAQRITALENK
jgi:hypothetical protein